jgi:hypothetical protein
MYTEKHVIPLFLKACPGWKEALEKVRADWHGNKPNPYNEISSLAHFLVNPYKDGTTSDFPKIFNTLELIIQEGNHQAKELLVVGLIEDLQNISTSESLGSDIFKPWLREESRKAMGLLKVVQYFSAEPTLDLPGS